jgi:hypothetical protein
MELKSKIEQRKIFRPTSLSSGEKLCRGKIFQILVISENINRVKGALKVMMPNSECFKDSK